MPSKNSTALRCGNYGTITGDNTRFAGGVIGFGRSKCGRPAGFRTYMLISVGAAMSTLLALYQYKMLTGQWADTVSRVGLILIPI